MSGDGWPYTEEQYHASVASGIYLCDACGARLYSEDLERVDAGEQERNLCAACGVAE